MPVLFKEFMTEGEYFTLIKKLNKDETINRCGGHLKDCPDKIYDKFDQLIVGCLFKEEDENNLLNDAFESYRKKDY